VIQKLCSSLTFKFNPEVPLRFITGAEPSPRQNPFFWQRTKRINSPEILLGAVFFVVSVTPTPELLEFTDVPCVCSDKDNSEERKPVVTK
jgi:hypothetical protein